MFYGNTVNQLSLLITVCFSFVNIIFTLSLNRTEPFIRLLSAAFVIPLFLCFASFLTGNGLHSAFFLDLSEVFLLLAILFLLRMEKLHFPSAFFVLCSLPPAICLVFPYLGPVRLQWIVSYAVIPAVLLPALAILFLLRRANGHKKLLRRAVLLLLLSVAVKAFGNSAVFLYACLCLKLSAYIVFFMFFFRETHSKLTEKILAAEKKLKAVDRSLQLEVNKRVFEIERSNEKLVNISKTDSLTGALNKAAILEAIGKLIDARRGSRFCILMFDIDNFKRINDTLGHVTGDKCIKRLALAAKSSLREIDSLGRYGGDEFIILLPNTTLPQAGVIAERFRKKVEDAPEPKFTVSIGIAGFPEDAGTVTNLVSFADEGLYISKSRGKNRVTHKGSM